MPGTIRVSVLEFTGLPSSLPQSVSLKVSMGKREYQTWDRGDFSFPLTTLKDSLIVTIHDAKGNEISYAGVQAKSIVEKGFWDDVFPLEGGGGHVHLQLHFVLSEDERDRIRLMREAAMKRKQNEHLNRSPKSIANTTSPQTKRASSFYLNHDFSDSQKCLLQIEELSVSNNVEEPGNDSSSRTHLDRIQQQTPSDADRQEEISSTVSVLQMVDVQFPEIVPNADKNEETSSTVPVLQGVDILLSQPSNEELVERQGARSPHGDTHEVTSSTTIGSEIVYIHQPEQSNNELAEGGKFWSLPVVNAHLPEPSNKESAEGTEIGSLSVAQTANTHLPRPREENKTLSSHPEGASQTVSLESSQPISTAVRNERRVDDNAEEPAPLKKSRSSVWKMVSAFESNLAQDMRPSNKSPLKKNQSSLVEKQAFLLDDHLDIIEKKEKQKDLKDGDKSSRESRNFPEIKGKEPESNEKEFDTSKEKPRMELLRTTTPTAATVLGRNIIEGNPDCQSTSNLVNGNQAIVEKSKRRTSSMDKLEKPVEEHYHKDDRSCLSEISKPWVFPDEKIHLCVTGGGKKVMDLVAKTSASTPSLHENVNKISIEEHRGVSPQKIEGNKINKTDRKTRNPEPDDESSQGLVAQAIKIAIMVGFGTLVLVARQRTNRNN